MRLSRKGFQSRPSLPERRLVHRPVSVNVFDRVCSIVVKSIPRTGVVVKDRIRAERTVHAYVQNRKKEGAAREGDALEGKAAEAIVIASLNINGSGTIFRTLISKIGKIPSNFAKEHFVSNAHPVYNWPADKGLLAVPRISKDGRSPALTSDEGRMTNDQRRKTYVSKELVMPALHAAKS